MLGSIGTQATPIGSHQGAIGTLPNAIGIQPSAIGTQPQAIGSQRHILTSHDLGVIGAYNGQLTPSTSPPTNSISPTDSILCAANMSLVNNFFFFLRLL